MKKYLFLLFLFCFYLSLINHPKTKQTLSYDNNEKGIILCNVNFNNGINSNNLVNLLNSYQDEFLINMINDIKVSCNEVDICIKQVYEQMDYDFESDYIANGFKINTIKIITSSEKINKFLNKNKLNYYIN